MTVTLSGRDLAIAQRLSALVCSHAWKGKINTVRGWEKWLEHHSEETFAIVDALGGPDNWGEVADYLEYQRCQWWRLMGMASRPWGDEDGA